MVYYYRGNTVGLCKLMQVFFRGKSANNTPGNKEVVMEFHQP